MEPLIVGVEFETGGNLLMALDLQLMQLSQMTLGADMGKEVRGVSKGGLLRADAAVEHGGHDADVRGRRRLGKLRATTAVSEAPMAASTAP